MTKVTVTSFQVYYSQSLFPNQVMWYDTVTILGVVTAVSVCVLSMARDSAL